MSKTLFNTFFVLVLLDRGNVLIFVEKLIISHDTAIHNFLCHKRAEKRIRFCAIDHNQIEDVIFKVNRSTD